MDFRTIFARSFGILFAFTILTSSLSGQNVDSDPNDNATTEKFHTLLYHLENAYVDSVRTSELTETAIKAMLKELDPHSVYIPKEEVEKMRQPLEGNFDGIGIRFDILKDTILVVNPIPGGPSEKLGIQAGDKIVKIEGETVAGIGINNSGVRNRLLGEKGSTVEVAIYRKSEPELIHYEIVRDKIPIRSVEASYMAEPDVGYIKVSRFSNRTMEEFEKAMKELKKKGMKDLVLDLQGNGGGYLKTAIKMADHFLEKDRLVVYTEGRAFPRQERRASNDGMFEDGKLVVMVDQSSASASEIVAGAVQDWDRGAIVGRRSFGKGMVQRPIDLPDGSVVRLTISRYHTPSGRCIQKPYEKGDRKDYAKKMYKRWETGELYHLDSIDIADSLRYETRIKERTVYGGGGIIPDIFVPLDTSGNSEYWSQLNRKGILNKLALNFADEKRKTFKKEYDGAKGFSRNFKISTELKERMVELGKDEDLEYDRTEYERSERYIKAQLKSMIAQNIWGREAYFRVYNPLKPSYQRAMEVLKDGTFEKMDLAGTR